MKRLVTALGLGGIVFGGIFGLAASLNASSGTLGAASDAVAACQASPVSVDYTPSYSATATAGYRATTVTVGGLDTDPAACGDRSFKVTLSGAGDASLGEQTGTTPTSGTTADVTFSGVNASDVTGVHVVIYG